METEYIEQIAKGIFDVLRLCPKYLMSWGVIKINATTFKDMAAVSFVVNGFLHKGKVVVAYNEGCDLYEVYCLSKKGDVVKCSEDVYFDILVDTIDRMVEKECSDKEYHAKINEWFKQQTEEQTKPNDVTAKDEDDATAQKREHIEKVIRENRHPESYELDRFIDDKLESIADNAPDDDILTQFDEWLEEADLYYEKIRDQNYWSSIEC